jgi:hypothetical protein
MFFGLRRRRVLAQVRAVLRVALVVRPGVERSAGQGAHRVVVAVVLPVVLQFGLMLVLVALGPMSVI